MMCDAHSPASSDDGKPIENRARGFRLLQYPHRHFRDHAEKAFRAVDEAEQIVAGCIEMFTAKAQDFAGDEHDLAAEHVIGGHAVFQAMHPAGIFRHVAANRARNLRGWIRRVIKSCVRNRIADRKIGHARLHDHNAIFEIDLADAIEFGHAEQHAIRQWNAPPDSDVPAPRGTTLIPSPWQYRRI